MLVSSIKIKLKKNLTELNITADYSFSIEDFFQPYCYT